MAFFEQFEAEMNRKDSASHKPDATLVMGVELFATVTQLIQLLDGYKSKDRVQLKM